MDPSVVLSVTDTTPPHPVTPWPGAADLSKCVMPSPPACQFDSVGGSGLPRHILACKRLGHNGTQPVELVKYSGATVLAGPLSPA
jgi:hypothetical protein